MFSAYTIKKMLPRLILAVIAVNLSWYIAVGMLNVASILGNATRGILLTPFAGFESDVIGTLSGGQQSIIGGGLLAGAGIVVLYSSFAIFTPIIVGGLFALLIGYVALVLRQVFIIMMILLSPILIVLWVLPGTENTAKKAVSLFMKLLIMYPVIIALLTSGKIISVVVNNGSDTETAPKVVAMIALFAPYFMIPFVLKFIGGALASISNMANDRTRGVIDGLRKRGGEKAAENRAANRMGRRLDGTNKFANFANKALFRASRPTSLAAGIGKGRIGGKAMAQYHRNRSIEAYAAQEELYKAGVRDHDVANELAVHGATSGKLRSRVQELKSQGRHDLAQRLSRVQDLSGSRYQIGAMEIAAGFGKLDDRALRELNNIYDKPGDLGSKAAALGSLREASKKAGNFATFSSYLKDGQVQTYTNADGSIDDGYVDNNGKRVDGARQKLAKALQDAGPGILGQQKQYESVDDSGQKIYDTKAAGVAAVAYSAASEFQKLAQLDPSTGGVIDGKMITPTEMQSRQKRAVEALVQLQQPGAYTDTNTKVAADRAYEQYIAGTQLESVYSTVKNEMMRTQAPTLDNTGAPQGPPPGVAPTTAPTTTPTPPPAEPPSTPPAGPDET